MTDMLDEAQIPFEENRQNALVGRLFTDPDLFERLKGMMKSDWFINNNTRKLVAYLIEFTETYKNYPKSKDDFFGSTLFFREKPEDRAKLISHYQACFSLMKNYQMTNLNKDLEDWMKFVYLKNMLVSTQKLINLKELNKAGALINEAMGGFFKIKLDNKDEEDMGDPNSVFQKSIDSQIGACTIGSKLLDGLINESAQDGGLLKKEMTIVMAATNSGKSTFMINAAVANVIKGKRVLFIALEDTAQNLKEKIWCTYLDESRKAMELYAKNPGLVTPTQKATGDAAAQLMRDNFAFMPYVRAEMTLESIIPVIKAKYQESLGRFGKGFDLIICDYPAILQTEWVKGGGESYTRSRMDHIYRTFSQLAQQLDSHVLTAIQTNRAASKMNRFGNNDDDNEGRMITVEDVSEAFGPMQIANTVISLNRSTEEQNLDFMYVHVCKTRGTAVGTTMVTKTNFKHGRTHGWNLPSCWYYGTSRLSSMTALKALSRSKEYQDGKIPTEELVEFNK